MIIKKVGIIGAGTMGQGIAHAVAVGGYQVTLHDINRSLLDRAIDGIRQNLEKGVERGKLDRDHMHRAFSNITLSQNLQSVKADLIIEAVVEDLQVKIDIFSKLESINNPETILASNTSSIPINKIGSGLKYPSRMAGLHFFNPAHIMKLVEVIKAKNTATETIKVLIEFTKSIDKFPVKAADSPGFIVNRVARHYYLESLKILEDKVADHQTIDDLLVNYGFRMGPFKLMDLIGIDVNFAVTKSIYESFERHPKFKPSKIQQAKVEAGHLGKKTGSGFYQYE